jgi:hypothetical protein
MHWEQLTRFSTICSQLPSESLNIYKAHWNEGPECRLSLLGHTVNGDSKFILLLEDVSDNTSQSNRLKAIVVGNEEPICTLHSKYFIMQSDVAIVVVDMERLSRQSASNLTLDNAVVCRILLDSFSFPDGRRFLENSTSLNLLATSDRDDRGSGYELFVHQPQFGSFWRMRLDQL